jgi:hypothetical protein
MLLQHTAAVAITELLDIVNVTSFTEFSKRLGKAASKQDPDLYDPLCYKGDVFEVFAEFFFKFFNGDHVLTYIADYEPNMEYDRGIDGRGKSTLGGDAVVQVKYSSDPSHWLTNKENISNIVADACVNEGLTLNGKNVVLITSCKGVHPKHAMANVHCINREQITRRVDKNEVFWSDFKAVIQDTIQAYENQR